LYVTTDCMLLPIVCYYRLNVTTDSSDILFANFDVRGSVYHSIIHIKIQQDATVYHNLFHVYIKLNMFRATHRPSSGA